MCRPQAPSAASAAAGHQDARPPETTVRYSAGFWLQVAAAIVDAIILTVAWQVIELALPAQNVRHSSKAGLRRRSSA